MQCPTPMCQRPESNRLVVAPHFATWALALVPSWDGDTPPSAAPAIPWADHAAAGHACCSRSACMTPQYPTHEGKP